MSEHDEQRALFEWAAWCEGKAPELGLLFAIPNGGARHPAVAAKLKAEGVRPGVWDVFLPVARKGYHGCWLELKFGKNNLTDAQALWRDAMTAEGYGCYVCYTWTSAARLLCDYLNYDAKELGL